MTKTFAENVVDTHYLLNDMSALPKPQPNLDANVLNLFSLRGKVCVITGGGRGIGLAVAEAYAQAGGDIALWDIEAPVEAAAKLTKSYGITAKAYGGDVTQIDSVNNLVEEIEHDFGTIDVFVANAGIARVGSVFNENSEIDFKRTMDVNVSGVFYCARAAGKVFKKHGKGSFVVTGSMSGHIVNTPIYISAYNASKAAVIHLAKSLAIEFMGFARVNSVSPGYIDSGINDALEGSIRKRWLSIIPMGREGSCRELVGAYLYFASDASTYTTGSEIVVDGGYTIV